MRNHRSQPGADDVQHRAGLPHGDKKVFAHAIGA
jgi:hypothetical protein